MPLKIRIVDDEEPARQGLTALLGRWGYDVDEAADGQEALAKAAAGLPSVVLFDLVMPTCGHVPSAAVVIVTMKALRVQGGSKVGSGSIEAGYPNLQRHLENLRRWGVPAVVAMNRFPGDSDADHLLNYPAKMP